MNQHLVKAIATYEQEGIDFQQLLTWHLCHGVVICDMDCFAFGFSSFSENPTEPVQSNYRDTLFITYCCGDMATMLNAFNKGFRYVAFQRDMKNSPRLRLWDYKKTLKRISHGITI
jgi:hypothetical protein